VGGRSGEISTPAAPIVAALDVGGTIMKGGLVRDTNVWSRVIEPTPKPEEGGRTLDAVLRLCRWLTSVGPVAAIGLCVKGIVDPALGTLVEVNESLLDLVRLPLADIVSWELHRPTFVENDARMYALGELVGGRGRDSQNLVCITLGTGVGTSVAIDRHILRGTRGTLGVLAGHLTVSLDGPRCTCGNLGCLEALIGAGAIVGSARNALILGRKSTLQPAGLSPEAVFGAAAAGDELARNIVADFNQRLGAGIVSLIHAYDPDLVVLGGGMMGSSRQIVGPVQAYVDAHAWTIPRGRVRVEPAALGDGAALVGVAELATRGHEFL
jgi:glucokinase